MLEDVFFCENNVSKGLEPIIDKLEDEYEDVEFFIEPCLGHCSFCAKHLYCVIRVEKVSADTPDELYEAIKKKLDDLLKEN